MPRKKHHVRAHYARNPKKHHSKRHRVRGRSRRKARPFSVLGTVATIRRKARV